MISRLIEVYHNLRRKIGLTWRKQWKLRSYFVPGEVRRKSGQFLHEHASNMFFILGTGRSGTQLITELLSLNTDVSVFHEPNFGEDVGTMDSLRRGNQLALDYWRRFRNFEVYSRWISTPNARLYGEVNGTIRYQTPAIHELYPDAKLFLISRNGQGVVRSVMGWPQFYASTSTGAYNIEPLEGDPYFERWKDMTRFEKVCWSWMDTNEFLMLHIPTDQWLQLEMLASNYNYCKELLLEPLGINLSYENWQSHFSKKSKNATRTYAFPAWDEWTGDQRKIFESMCGDTMAKLGYKF